MGAKFPDSELPEERQKELQTLALQMLAGRVFTDRDVVADDPTLLASIFLPIALMENVQEWIKNTGLLYEYYEFASPRAINGYPTFMSVHRLSVVEADYLTAVARILADNLCELFGVDYAGLANMYLARIGH